MNLKKKKKGFTLIELMAVIAIIAILAAVLVPSVNGYISRAKKTAIITQARTVVGAVETHNATAENQINTSAESTVKLEDVIEIVGEDLLNNESVSKLPKATPVQVLLDINKDENSIKDIKITKDGKLEEYNGTKITQDTVVDETK